ncbi:MULTISPECIES: RNA polymerase factor sigma-54 [Hyphomicrobium]|jgi:RNA polymerase sigma-54 factor|uniref:RNA polymerase factor sigma-54 n=1 Tax=Hyphomicrobium TaxID=81 RepID=UPI00036F59CC|nr:MULTISPECIES: RNA polymerase factor sigma-54 [Hyphomicrobium]WBT38878.1 RNA polymerase factor sigma-54 [Hyphomicrobium sp. DMF-1]HML42299.1 RNA polymerase factor sigma-54 [Hyphomicrobium zavarzinii]
MALTAKLELRQGQQLVMTPQLQQAIRLLQLSNLELGQFVETELERNPLLEMDDTPEAAPKAEREAEPETPSERSEQAGDDEWLDLGKPVAEADGGIDGDYDGAFVDNGASPNGPDGGESGWASLRQRSNSFSDDDINPEAFVSSEPSLRDHLSEQLPLAVKDHVERLIGQHLIDMVDEAGYLHADLDQLATKLGAPLALVEKVLATLQTLDPPGVFARSLAECLALQLKEQNRYDPQIAALLDNLDLLAAHNLPALRKAVGADMSEITDMIEEIKHLNPKPGLKFGSVQLQPVVPDVLVRQGSDGGWIIELNSDTLPRVLVNRTYFAQVNKTTRTEKDRGYLLECLQTANWLVKSLDQRARTILKVAEEIVRQQDAFFTYGVQHLRPLNLKTVADAISMHESTVSRVTSNKYMATPRGIFELKYFFTSAIQASGEGEAHSSEAVRHRIKQMIDGESAKSILSDDKLVEKLRAEGIDIARRTVAKYREAMRIPSSVQRRREKQLAERMAR